MIFFRILWREFKKEILTTISYKTQWFGEFLALIIFYLYLNKIPGAIEFSAYYYCLWFYSTLIIGDISSKITSELRMGTFEQIYLSTFSLISLFVAKIISSILRCALLMLALLFLLVTTGDASFYDIHTSALWLAALCITPGLFGLSLFLGGIALLIKDAGWLLNIVNNSVLFLSGVFISPELLPNWLQNISIAIPTTQAITLVSQSGLAPIQWFLALGCSLLNLCCGLVCFFVCDRLARKMGVIGYY